jgi:rhodanese-related sulfurtransferase
MDQEWSVAELAIGVEQGRVLLLDVRPSEDVAIGHIPGSWLVPMPALAGRLHDPADALHQVVQRSSPTVPVIAGDAERFAAAKAALEEVGRVAVGVRGEVAAWSREGRPLNRGQSH